MTPKPQYPWYGWWWDDGRSLKDGDDCVIEGFRGFLASIQYLNQAVPRPIVPWVYPYFSGNPKEGHAYDMGHVPEYLVGNTVFTSRIKANILHEHDMDKSTDRLILQQWGILSLRELNGNLGIYSRWLSRNLMSHEVLDLRRKEWAGNDMMWAWQNIMSTLCPCRE